MCATLEFFYILLSRLAGWRYYEDFTLPDFWVLVRAKQLPGPLAIGSVEPLLFGLQALRLLQTCVAPLGGQRGPP